jgi:hypothetical protein
MVGLEISTAYGVGICLDVLSTWTKIEEKLEITFPAQIVWIQIYLG